MPSRIVWLPRAKLSLDHQLDYLEARNPRSARTVAEEIIRSTDRLQRFPNSGRIGRKLQTRELVVTGTPFLIVYRVEPGTVVILRVLHGAQRWPEVEQGD